MRELLVALERITGRLATTAFVAVSRANLQSGLDLDLYGPDRVTLIRSGIRLSDFSPRSDGNGQAPASRPGPDRPVTVGMVACLKPQKAPLDFIRVAARVVRGAGVPVRFVLAGDGDLRGQVEAMIRAEGIGAHVTLEGWRRDIPDLMRGLDLLIHTSLWEGLPRVFPEAMATGLPIVATRVDGAPEAIEDGVTGFLVAPGDIEGLSRLTIDLVRDPALRRRMGDEALKRTAPWDIDEMVRRQERLYEGLMAGETARAVALSTQMEG
jgi:glycosyltransferase involved in cell wall biosynthesis